MVKHHFRELYRIVKHHFRQFHRIVKHHSREVLIICITPPGNGEAPFQGGISRIFRTVPPGNGEAPFQGGIFGIVILIYQHSGCGTKLIWGSNLFNYEFGRLLVKILQLERLRRRVCSLIHTHPSTKTKRQTTNHFKVTMTSLKIEKHHIR